MCIYIYIFYLYLNLTEFSIGLLFVDLDLGSVLFAEKTWEQLRN